MKTGNFAGRCFTCEEKPHATSTCYLLFWSWMSFAGNNDDPRCLEVVVLRWGSPGDSRRFITSTAAIVAEATDRKSAVRGGGFCPSKIQTRKKGLRTAFIRARVGERDAVTPLSQTVTRLLLRQVFVWAKKRRRKLHKKCVGEAGGAFLFFIFNWIAVGDQASIDR